MLTKKISEGIRKKSVLISRQNSRLISKETFLIKEDSEKSEISDDSTEKNDEIRELIKDFENDELEKIQKNQEFLKTSMYKLNPNENKENKPYGETQTEIVLQIIVNKNL